MKELELNIGPFYVDAKRLEDISCCNKNYYKVKSFGDSCCIYSPYNIIQEIYNEKNNYYEYSLGGFEGEVFIPAFSWISEYGAASIFGHL